MLDVSGLYASARWVCWGLNPDWSCHPTFAMSGALAWQVKKNNKKKFRWFLGGDRTGFFARDLFPLCVVLPCLATFHYASLLLRILRYYLRSNTLHGMDSSKIFNYYITRYHLSNFIRINYYWFKFRSN